MPKIFHALAGAGRAVALLVVASPGVGFAAQNAASAGRTCTQVQGVAMLAGEFAFTQERPVG
jgi:hypothetical protein